MIRCVDVLLAIPDNEALTALATLQRLGVAIGGLERADLYRFDVAENEAGRLVAMLRGLETVFNPNKHVLRVRDGDEPAAGEVWIDEIGPRPAASGPLRIAGRILPGVRAVERCIAWRAFAATGEPASPGIVAVATETLLCNPAFQKARLSA